MNREELFDKINRKAQEAFGTATQMYSIYELATRMTMPNMDSFFTPKGDKGNSKSIMNLRQLYTNTGVLSAKEFMSFALRYFQLNEKQKIQLNIKPNKAINVEQNPQLKGILNVLSDTLNQVLTDSNINKCAEKLVANLLLGEAPLQYYWDRKEGMKFISIPLDQIALGDSTDGTTVEFFRKRTDMPIKEIKGMWAELIDIKKIDDIEVDRDSMDKKITITEAFVYNYDKNVWNYYVMSEKSILVEREFDKVPPFYTVEWMKKSGTPYAIGQAIMVLAELLTMNRTEFLIQYGFAMRAVPAWIATDHAALDPRTLRIAPNAINVKPKDAEISALQAGDMPAMVIDWLSGKQLEIQKGLSDNTLLGVGKNASATEIEARTTLMNRAEIFLFRRAIDFYKWVVDVTMYEMFRNGIIDDSVITWDEYKEYIDVTINGLQPQDAATLQKANSALMFYYNLDQTGALAKMALNLPRVFAGVNDAMRMPTGWANDEMTIKDNLDQMQELQNQMANTQLQKEQADTQDKLANAAMKEQEIEVGA